MFDVDDIAAALEELESRYIAGDAAAYSHTWSVIAETFAAINRHQVPPTTPGWAMVDHRPIATFETGDLAAFLEASWALTAHASIHIEAVHRLSELGAVVTHASHATSQEGLDAEWHDISIVTVDEGLIDRCEMFDHADLDAALARFAELHPQTPRLKNTASQVGQRYRAHFAAGDWDAMAAIIADDFVSDDRRRVVGSGIRTGREAQIADMRAISDLFIADMTSTDIATRGDRLLLFRVGFLDRDQRPDAFRTEVLCILEIDAEERIVTSVSFDLDDIDAAFEELDARYLAGEAAHHARTWSVISLAYTAMNRHELPATTPDWINIDHRRGIAFAPGQATSYLLASHDPEGGVYVETVHRLGRFGAVFTWAGRGISKEGFEAEWRGINVLTVQGELISRGEIFDEADLDAALARFEELHLQTRRPQNAASRASDRYLGLVVAHDWDAVAEMLADDYYTDDRRRVVGGGIHGRDAEIASVQAQANLGVTHASATVIAARGERLALSRVRYSGRDQELEVFVAEILIVFEINADDRFAAAVAFDLDDIDAAFKELDARYLADEAAAHAHTWSVITGGYVSLNRREMPATTPNFVDIDHRPLAIAAGDLKAYVATALSDDMHASLYVESVHRLSDLGAVVTHAASGTSREGFDAEWRMTIVFTVEGGLLSRCEIFDEADLDAALARFEELHPQAPRLENAASQLIERFQAYFATRNWAAIAENSAAEIFTDDRRAVVGSGFLGGRDLDIANMRAAADLGSANLTSAVIATRGERLALARLRMSGRDQRPEAFHSDMLGIVEIDADNRVTARILFDLNDIDAAFEELDARYLAGEAADHVHSWSVIAQTSAAFNRHELPVADWVVIDHRRLAPVDTSDLPAAIRAIWDLTPDLSTRIEAVHRLGSFGAVVTYTAHGTSTEGFAAEWRVVDLLTVEGDRISRFEFFDEADLDAALARFDELSTRSQPK